MQKYFVGGCIKGILIIWPKTKKSLSKLSLLQGHPEENARVGGSRKLLLFSSNLNYCSTVSLKAYLLRSLNLWKAWKSFDDVIKSSDHFLGYPATKISIFMNQKLLNSGKFVKKQFHKFTDFRHRKCVIERYV